MKKNKHLVAKSVLAQRLKVSPQVVHNWVARGLIYSEHSADMGMVLVENITEKPTKSTYGGKKVISAKSIQ